MALILKRFGAREDCCWLIFLTKPAYSLLNLLDRKGLW